MPTRTASIERVHLVVMGTPFDPELFAQNSLRAASHILLIEQTDSGVVARLANAVIENRSVDEFTEGSGERMLFRVRFVIAVQAAVHDYL